MIGLTFKGTAQAQSRLLVLTGGTERLIRGGETSRNGLVQILTYLFGLHCADEIHSIEA